MSQQDQRLVYESGQWQVHLGRRELRAGGVAISIGARAFEIVELLVRSANELVTKDDLMARIWPGAVVGENTIHVHVSAIRRALGRDRAMLKTVSGRGYRLLGNWTARRHEASALPLGLQQVRATVETAPTNFPATATRLIGRSMAVQQLRDFVSAYRVVTLTGPGGIGKTALALKVGRCMLAEFGGGGWFVELASLTDPALVPSVVAQALGLKLVGDRISAESVASAVGGQHLLLLLDNCEHLIDAVADLAQVLVRFCPRSTILATSREAFRIDGEYVYRVMPLDVPAVGQQEADDILRHSAVELFLAKTQALGSDFSTNAKNLPGIATICRRLDGIPLAIAFAAARAAALGVDVVAAGLLDRLTLLSSGYRNTVSRHRTLRATLDWSYELLPQSEQLVFRRLAIFPAGFTLDAAQAVMSDSGLDSSAVVGGIASLVEKSLVTLDSSEVSGRWYMLETMRNYALEKLERHGETAHAARRHAMYFRDFFASAAAGFRRPVAITELTRHSRDLDNVRAALEWCFGVHSNVEIGLGLASVAAPVFLAMSLLPECRRWSKQALVVLDNTTRGGHEEMHLQAALGMSSTFTRGNSEEASAALSRSLAIATDRGDAPYQLQLLGILHTFHHRIGDFRTALQYAKQSSVLSKAIKDPAALALAHCLLGVSLHHLGDLRGARVELEAALRHGPAAQWINPSYPGFDGHNIASVVLARILWMQGHPAQAAERACQTVKDAETKGHSVTLCIALIWAISVFLWNGDLESAESHQDWLFSSANSHSLAPYLAICRGFRGEIAIRRGDAKGGVESLKSSLRELHAIRFELLTTAFEIALVQGLAALGRFAEGIALIDEAHGRIEASGGDVPYLPELWRVKGALLLQQSEMHHGEAETCLLRALELSRRQGARAWELRTAIDWAGQLIAREQHDSARAVLQPVFEQFKEGLDTADLKLAASQLERLG